MVEFYSMYMLLLNCFKAESLARCVSTLPLDEKKILKISPEV